jgi:hypothetical protein
MLGSNAIRNVVGRLVYDGEFEVVENLRLPVRLGLDTLICWNGGYLRSAKGFLMMYFGVKLIIVE